ncbi:MAG: spore coat associated protein CotJA [Clostridiales bacterium]|nr:spore coat associated protein CotJA [Clostridiales bacterium]
MPACAPLAVPYVPFQQEGSQKYDQSNALANGTIFPGLNLPFHLKVDAASLPANTSTQLQALLFVVTELGMYLDTHPNDAEAFQLFQQYTELAREAKRQYEEQHGPATQLSAGQGKTYRWLDDPWPWDFKKSEGD